MRATKFLFLKISSDGSGCWKTGSGRSGFQFWVLSWAILELIASTIGAKVQARKRPINIIFFVRLVLGRPRVCPGDFTGLVPGTNPVKTCDKPGFPPYFTQWKPGFHRVCPWDKPSLSLGQSRGRRAAQKVYVKKVYVPFSLAKSVNIARFLCSLERTSPTSTSS